MYGRIHVRNDKMEYRFTTTAVVGRDAEDDMET